MTTTAFTPDDVATLAELVRPFLPAGMTPETAVGVAVHEARADDELADKVATLTDLTRGIDDDHYPTTADYLQALPMIAQTADSALRTAVAQARTEGASWDAIGRWLGVSRQAAWERYGA